MQVEEPGTATAATVFGNAAAPTAAFNFAAIANGEAAKPAPAPSMAAVFGQPQGKQVKGEAPPPEPAAAPRPPPPPPPPPPGHPPATGGGGGRGGAPRGGPPPTRPHQARRCKAQGKAWRREPAVRRRSRPHHNSRARPADSRSHASARTRARAGRQLRRAVGRDAAAADAGRRGAPGGESRIVQWVVDLETNISRQIDEAMLRLGVGLLEDPQKRLVGDQVHDAIAYMRWGGSDSDALDVSTLCGFERVLSAHQIYVQSQENFWEQRSNYLGKEKERAFRELRKEASASTEKDKDNETLRTNGAARQLYVAHRVSEAMAKAHFQLGDRFAQLLNGLKRSIDLKLAERQTSIHQSKFTN